MTEPRPGPKRVVLRYEDSWDELHAQLHRDRQAGLAPSVVRDAVAGWLDGGQLFEVGSLVRRASSSYRGGDAAEDDTAGPDTAAANEGGEVPADGLIAGWGYAAGRLVFVVAEDPALGSEVRGGAAAAKATRMRAHALEQSAPLVQVLASRRIEPDAFIGAEFVRFGYGVDLDFEADSSSRILKIAIVTGPLVDQAALEASACHLVLLAGPQAGLYGHDGDETLRRSLADQRLDDLPAALAVAGAAMEVLPANRFDGPPTAADPAAAASDGAPDAASPHGLLDAGWCQELAPGRCPELRTVLGRIGGRLVGLAESTSALTMQDDAAGKLRRLLGFCDAFRLPLVLAHHGWQLDAGGDRAEIDAVLACFADLASATTTVVEAVFDGAGLAATAGVRATWSAGIAPMVGADATVPQADLRAELAAVLAALPPSRSRPDQDPRIARIAPRTLS